MTRTWAYADDDRDGDPTDQPARSREGASSPEDAPRGAARVELGEPVARRLDASTPSQQRDTRIHDEVCARLEADERIDTSELEVIVHQGEVILSGAVRDAAERDRVRQIADQAKSVVDVVTRVRIVPEGGRGGSPG